MPNTIQNPDGLKLYLFLIWNVDSSVEREQVLKKKLQNDKYHLDPK